MEPQAFQLQQYMHLTDHILHVETVDMVGLKTGTIGGEKKGKLSLCLALPYVKRMG